MGSLMGGKCTLRTGHGRVNTRIYRGEMNRISAVNGRETKTELERTRARELDICNGGLVGSSSMSYLSLHSGPATGLSACFSSLFVRNQTTSYDLPFPQTLTFIVSQKSFSHQVITVYVFEITLQGLAHSSNVSKYRNAYHYYYLDYYNYKPK